MNHQPLVSVIVNCYNGEKYLEEALKSLRTQTYENFEVIFWDNQSTDKSANIFKRISDNRFKYFYAEKHTNLYEARNLAIEKSKGDFISFLDCDDLWLKNKLDLQLSLFSDPEVGVVYSNFWLMKKDKNKKKIFTKKKLYQGYIYGDLTNNYNVGIVTVVLRKKIYQSLEKKFDKRFSIIGDFDLILRLSEKYKFIGVEEPLAFCRLHNQSFSIINKKKEALEHQLWLDENRDKLEKGASESIQNNINMKLFMHSKMSGHLKECLNIMRKNLSNLKIIKMIAIFFMPVFIFQKISWFYHDFKK